MSGTAKAKPRAARPVPKDGPAPRWRLWLNVGLLVTLVLLGLPLAHAMFGEIAALLGGAVLFGFLLGRWTAPR